MDGNIVKNNVPFSRNHLPNLIKVTLHKKAGLTSVDFTRPSNWSTVSRHLIINAQLIKLTRQKVNWIFMQKIILKILKL